MKQLHFFLSLLLLLSTKVQLYGQLASIVPSSVSIANTSVARSNEWNAFWNVAALAHIKSPEASIQYENRFMLAALSTRSFQAGINTQLVNVGISYAYHGYSTCNEMVGGIGLARNFGDKFSMGLQFNYHAAYFSGDNENRYRGVISTQFGVTTKLLPKFSVGFHTFNPFQSNIKTEYTIKTIPSVFSIGASYEFTPKLIWLMQVDKEASSTFRLASGFEYNIVEQLTVKLGAYGHDYLIPALGFALHLGHLHFHLNGELHPLLGINTLGNVTYRF